MSGTVFSAFYILSDLILAAILVGRDSDAEPGAQRS